MVYSGELANIIGSLLKVDPNKRPDTDEILSSNLVRKRYKGELEYDNQGEDDFDELLKTIKFNPKDLKGLKNYLPKANYDDNLEEKDKLKLEEMKGGIQSCKNARKEPNIKQEIKHSLDTNEKKLQEFMEKKRMLEEKERQRQIKMAV